MNTARAVVVSSCWFSLAIIASVYMLAFADQAGDVLFGILMPVGLLVLVGIIVTFVLAEDSEKQRSSA